LFDENGERRDKFPTKPSDPAAGKTSYVIRSVAFSPDSTRLAVAQSDHIVYVYKLGEAWNEKKVICNKFPQAASVTTMVWLSGGMIVAGNERVACPIFLTIVMKNVGRRIPKLKKNV
jgi:intraflagellar transport protein 172